MPNRSKLACNKEAAMTKRILFATDYSQASRQSLHFAASLARDNGATLLIAHVVETEGSAGTDSLDEGSGPSEAQLKQLQRVVPTGVQIPCEYKLLHGNPANKIAELAERENVDTIVICAHGHTRLGHLLGGSVAEAVMCQAQCAVIAFKPARHVRAAEAL
jgi:nucleotide-binding universal stress UspA family protein